MKLRHQFFLPGEDTTAVELTHMVLSRTVHLGDMTLRFRGAAGAPLARTTPGLGCATPTTVDIPGTSVRRSLGAQPTDAPVHISDGFGFVPDQNQ